MTISRIGVTCDLNDGICSVNERYLTALRDAGLEPVVLDPHTVERNLEQSLQGLAGLLFTGGPDVDPALFGGRPHAEVYGINPLRDNAEIMLIRRAAEKGLPFLGICRGIQVINVGLGGTLYTHIADQLPNALVHNQPLHKDGGLAHGMRVQAGTVSARILTHEHLEVNSMHHQGIENPAPDVIPTAWAPDGLIEMIELRGHPFGLAVQWHPECLVTIEAHRALFNGLAEAVSRGQ